MRVLSQYEYKWVELMSIILVPPIYIYTAQKLSYLDDGSSNLETPDNYSLNIETSDNYSLVINIYVAYFMKRMFFHEVQLAQYLIHLLP